MEREELSARQRITIGETTLLPIVRISLSCRNTKQGIVCFGSKNVIGIVVKSLSSVRAINVDGEEVPVEQYAEQVLEVRQLLHGT